MRLREYLDLAGGWQRVALATVLLVVALNVQFQMGTLSEPVSWSQARLIAAQFLLAYVAAYWLGLFWQAVVRWSLARVQRSPAD
jgi:hypothetical protein